MKNFFKKIQTNKGFSIVELIVVIAVLGVITVLAVPQFTKYIEKSRAGTDKNAMDEVLHAAEVAYVAYGKEERQDSVTIRIRKDGVSVYAPENTFVEKVKETVDAYNYKSEEYRGNTYKITISDSGEAILAETRVNNDLSARLEESGYKDDVEEAVKKATGIISGAQNGANAGSQAGSQLGGIFDNIFGSSWGSQTGSAIGSIIGGVTGGIQGATGEGGHEMTEEDWIALDDAAFKNEVTAEEIRNDLQNGNIDTLKDLFEDAGIELDWQD